MTAKPTFSDEIANLMYAKHSSPTSHCIQCGSCSGTCPATEFMDQTPRRLIGMINADLKDEVLACNTYWSCASCFHCTARCPAKIDIAGVMYAVKRYSIWNKTYSDDATGPAFSEAFMKMIVRSGRSYEPILAPTYIFGMGAKEMFMEVLGATKMMMKGRLPIFPARIDRLENFQGMVKRIIPMGKEV